MSQAIQAFANDFQLVDRRFVENYVSPLTKWPAPDIIKLNFKSDIPSKETFPDKIPLIGRITVNGKTIGLKAPLSFQISRIGNSVSVVNDLLNVSGVGFNIQEAMNDVKEFIFNDYFHYKTISNSNLSEDALELKNRYISLIVE